MRKEIWVRAVGRRSIRDTAKDTAGRAIRAKVKTAQNKDTFKIKQRIKASADLPSMSVTKYDLLI